MLCTYSVLIIVLYNYFKLIFFMCTCVNLLFVLRKCVRHFSTLKKKDEQNSNICLMHTFKLTKCMCRSHYQCDKFYYCYCISVQGRCRSCYAFSVTGALESMNALASNKIVQLSEQNIIDCSSKYFLLIYTCTIMNACVNNCRCKYVIKLFCMLHSNQRVLT